jgi:hypothetical protein
MKNDKTLLNLMIVAMMVLTMVIIGDNIHRSLTTSLSDRQNYEKRKKYYEEVIEPAGLDLHPAEYYIIINK